MTNAKHLGVTANQLAKRLKELKDENDKLRDLATGLSYCEGEYYNGKGCLACPLWDPYSCMADEYERELGIGVSE